MAQPLDLNNLKRLVEDACSGLGTEVKADKVLSLTVRDLYDGVPFDEVNKSLILSARSLIERILPIVSLLLDCCSMIYVVRP